LAISASLVIGFAVALSASSVSADVSATGPRVAFSGATCSVSLADTSLLEDESREITIVAAGEELILTLVGGSETTVEFTPRSGDDLTLSVDGATLSVDTTLFPGWLTVLPPALAIITVLITRQVIVSLIAGIFLGALILARFEPISAFAATFYDYVVGATAGDASRIALIFIPAMLGGMSAVISRSGGTRAVVERLVTRARGVRGAQIATWLMGLVIFFDDYANTLIVGNTMRPVTDRFKISREKLSFVVDATAAPVASIAPISTWIGFEVGLIQAALVTLGIERDAYMIFLQSIPYRFYPILALLLVFFVVWSGRDVGPMLTAERRARSGGGLIRPGASPLMSESDADMKDAGGPAFATTALFPIALVIILTLGGIILTGWGELSAGERSLMNLFGAGDSTKALLWASAAGSILAITLAVGRRSLSLRQAMDAWIAGLRAMAMAIVILVLAWAIGEVCLDMGTADVLVGTLSGRFPAPLLPAAVFLLSALVSFSTGTSWGTMAILMPITVPLAFALGGGSEHILLGAVSSVLAGSVFGDHCSPISDTTVLSSIASAADHIDHVRTQLPYALMAGAVGIALGDIPSAFGFPPWASLVLGAICLYLLLRWRGKRAEEVA